MIKTQEDAVNAQKDKAHEKAKLRRRISELHDVICKFSGDSELVKRCQKEISDNERRIREI